MYQPFSFNSIESIWSKSLLFRSYSLDRSPIANHAPNMKLAIIHHSLFPRDAYKRCADDAASTDVNNGDQLAKSQTLVSMSRTCLFFNSNLFVCGINRLANYSELFPDCHVIMSAQSL